MNQLNTEIEKMRNSNDTNSKKGAILAIGKLMDKNVATLNNGKATPVIYITYGENSHQSFIIVIKFSNKLYDNCIFA